MIGYSINSIVKNYDEWLDKYREGLITETEFLVNLYQITGDALRERLSKINNDKDIIVDALGEDVD